MRIRRGDGAEDARARAYLPIEAAGGEVRRGPTEERSVAGVRGTRLSVAERAATAVGSRVGVAAESVETSERELVRRAESRWQAADARRIRAGGCEQRPRAARVPARDL